MDRGEPFGRLSETHGGHYRGKLHQRRSICQCRVRRRAIQLVLRQPLPSTSGAVAVRVLLLDRQAGLGGLREEHRRLSTEAGRSAAMP
jgi:hypothetical protein